MIKEPIDSTEYLKKTISLVPNELGVAIFALLVGKLKAFNAQKKCKVVNLN